MADKNSLVFNDDKDIKNGEKAKSKESLQFEKSDMEAPQKDDDEQTLKMIDISHDTDEDIKDQQEEITEVKYKKTKFHALKVIAASIIGVVACICVIFGIIFANWMKDLPELDTSLLTEVSQSTLIHDKNGEVVASYSDYESRQWVSIDDVPQYMIDAVTSIEDKRFYYHHGIDMKRSLGAVVGQVTGSSDYGGSTLTQQLIKNVYLSSEVTYKRKAQEAVLALKLERQMSKDEIMEAYLNIIYLGSSNYGIKSAAKDYFGKDLNDLTLRECACIAGLTQNPNGYNPRKNYESGDMEKTNERTDTVLYTMYENGKISKKEYEEALSDELIISDYSQTEEIYPYAHYVEYTIDEVAKDLLESEGKELSASNIAYKKYTIRNGGYNIYTALDQNVQQTLQDEASTYDNYPEVDGDEQAQVSAVIMDQSNGCIVAMIGSRDEPTAKETYNRATDSAQPVASTIKPLSVFGPALELGLSPASMTPDYKTPVEGYDKKEEYPGGDCSEYPMSMRESLVTSHNIPAARFLMDVGMDTSAEYLAQLGLTASDIQETGSGLALGTSGFSTLEMTGAYAAIANGGTYIEPHAYTYVTDGNGNAIIKAEDYVVEREVFSDSTSYMLTDMMVSEVEYGTGQNAAIENMTVAGKTGTHEDKCVMFAGFTPHYTSVVRISSDSYLPMRDASGGNQAATLWHDYMAPIHDGLNNLSIYYSSQKEAGVETVEVCSLSGKLASDACRYAGCAVDELFASGTVPQEECDMHIALCTSSGCLATENCYDAEKIKILVYISEQNYLFDIDHELLLKTIENVTFDKPTDYECPYEHAQSYSEEYYEPRQEQRYEEQYEEPYEEQEEYYDQQYIDEDGVREPQEQNNDWQESQDDDEWEDDYGNEEYEQQEDWYDEYESQDTESYTEWSTEE